MHAPGVKVHRVEPEPDAEVESPTSLGGTLLAMLSPRTLFSFLLGFGATGLFLHPWLRGSALGLFALAVLGGWAFETLLVNPLGQFLFRFASTPARTLDTMALEEGRAATDFDEAGHGLISVDLDGQVRQVLGRLIPDERGPAAPRVRTGDRLFIRAVNRQRNTCSVSAPGLLTASSPPSLSWRSSASAPLFLPTNTKPNPKIGRLPWTPPKLSPSRPS